MVVAASRTPEAFLFLWRVFVEIWKPREGGNDDSIDLTMWIWNADTTECDMLPNLMHIIAGQGD